MDYRWKHKDKANSELVEHLSNEINVNPTLANVLVNRGIADFQQAKDFFRPDLDKLHDPYLMKDMNVAVQRLHQAIEKNEKILVYGDYDVDGTTSVALFMDLFNRFILM